MNKMQLKKFAVNAYILSFGRLATLSQGLAGLPLDSSLQDVHEWGFT
jgi:hypothetical protein